MKLSKITYLDKIRNKKVSNKVSDVFGCLTNEIKEEKKELVVKPQIILDKFTLGQFKSLNTQWKNGKLRKSKGFLKLAHFYKIQGLTIPEEVLKYCKIKKPKLRGKHKKLSKKARKDRVPKKYKIYIESHHWEDRKNKYYQTHEKRCKKCLSYNHVSLHHIVYGNYGRELDQDLAPLCENCHRDFHNKYGVEKNSHNSFMEFMEFD